MSLSIPFNRPNLRFSDDLALLESIIEIVKNGPYINGKYLKAFESKFSDFIGVEYVLGVSSGTSALELAILSLEDHKGDEVLLTANAGGYGTVAVTRLGLTPIYFDINGDGSPNFESFRERISERTCAVILTNLYGLVSDYSQFIDESRKHSITVIEDCAQSAGATYQNSGFMSGSLSDISTFSFYPTKNLSTFGDAGAIATNCRSIREKIKKLREYGWESKYKIEIPGGFNYRMDEIHAMTLVYQLNKLESYNTRRRNIWNTYKSALTHPSFTLIGRDDSSFVAHLAVIKSKNIDLLREYLTFRGVETQVHYPIADYNQPAFSNFKIESFPFTDLHLKSILSIPLYPEMKNDEILYVANLLREFSNEFK